MLTRIWATYGAVNKRISEKNMERIFVFKVLLTYLGFSTVLPTLQECSTNTTRVFYQHSKRTLLPESPLGAISFVHLEHLWYVRVFNTHCTLRYRIGRKRNGMNFFLSVNDKLFVLSSNPSLLLSLIQWGKIHSIPIPSNSVPQCKMGNS